MGHEERGKDHGSIITVKPGCRPYMILIGSV